MDRAELSVLALMIGGVVASLRQLLGHFAGLKTG